MSWPADDVLDICEQAGVPCIFDFHHHAGLNRGESWEEPLRRALATWPAGVRPKTHLSSPRDPLARPGTREFRAHADYVDAATARGSFERCEQLALPEFDVMLEAKAKDLAVLALRSQLAA